MNEGICEHCSVRVNLYPIYGYLSDGTAIMHYRCSYCGVVNDMNHNGQSVTFFSSTPADWWRKAQGVTG